MTANVGIAERADRLVAVLVTTGLVGLGLPEVVLTVVLLAAGRGQPRHRRPAHARRAPAGAGRRCEAGWAPSAKLVAVGATALGWGAVRRLPERAAYLVFVRLIAELTCRARRPRRATARANYARVRPDARPSELDAAGPRGHALLPAVLVRRVPAAGLTPRPISADCRAVEGDGPRARALERGRGRSWCFLGHIGNWDLAGAWSSRRAGAGDDGGRAAEAGGAVRAVPAFRERSA